MREQIGEVLEAEDIADAIVYAVSLPQRVNVNEILDPSRPASSASPPGRARRGGGAREPRTPRLGPLQTSRTVITCS